MSSWRLPAVVLPEGETRDLWVVGGRLTSQPQANAEALPGRFALPGLVDAHAHLAMGHEAAGDRDFAMGNLRAMRDQGVLLVRDIGAPRSVTLGLRPGVEDPRLLVAGRWHAPAGRFFPEYHDPVPAEALVEAALVEIAQGATWIKIIADWRDGSLSYEPAVVHALVEAVHGAGARVAAHTQWRGVNDLVVAGIDSVEHGSFLDVETVELMATRGVAWTPTLTAFTRPLPDDAPPGAPERREAWLGNVRAVLPVAVAHGVPILAGTDTAGTVVDEVAALIEFGLTPTQALEASTTGARRFLGFESLESGAPADLLTFDVDPREDPGVLATPAAILLRGVRLDPAVVGAGK